MKLEKPKYEYPIEGIASIGRPGEPAGIYMLDGNWHVAGLDTVAQALLETVGALHVLTVTFPTDPTVNPALN